MCCFAKYHLDELPVYQALDNFYGRMEMMDLFVENIDMMDDPCGLKAIPCQ